MICLRFYKLMGKKFKNEARSVYKRVIITNERTLRT